MPDFFNASATPATSPSAPDESGFAYVAGARAGFRDWASTSGIRSPELFDGKVASLHAAWDADVHAYACDESRVCIARVK